MRNVLTPSLQGKSRGFIATAMMIVKKESPLGLYKGTSMNPQS